MAGGGRVIGTDAVQRTVAGSSALPPLNMDNSHVDNIWNRPALQQDQRRQQQQPDFRAKNEITAPGKTLDWVHSFEIEPFNQPSPATLGLLL
jgi:hypothetical protein